MIKIILYFDEFISIINILLKSKMENTQSIQDQHQKQQQELDELIKQKRFEENSVSVGEGEDNWSFMPDNFRERRDLE